MESLCLLTSFTGAKGCSLVSGPLIYVRRDLSGAVCHENTFHSANGACFRYLLQSSYRSRCKFSVSARIKKGRRHEYPWPDNIDPNLKSGHLSYLSSFKPLTEKPKPVILDFERPLVELEKKITAVHKMAVDTGLDLSAEISSLERKYQEELKELYTHLTPYQRLCISRHPNRPTFLDHVLNITEKWVELHGDRAGYDDPAIVTGLGSIDGKTYMFIGHQKGRNTKENIHRNFGMPTPHGYRKALRMMHYADHHGFPIITFVDTPGAFADLKCEELGQGEAIAQNLRTMFGLKVPIVSVVIGEGGSGGALAIACPNKMFMLENAVFYVASPEACAAILWKTAKAAPKAAEKLKITAKELCKLKIADGIIAEPLGGAHVDPTWTSQQLKLVVTEAMKELGEMDTDALLEHRHLKFRQIGGIQDGYVASDKTHELKKNAPKITPTLEAKPETKATAPQRGFSGKYAEFERNVAMQTIKTFIAMGLQQKIESLVMDISKEPCHQNLSTILKERMHSLIEEFKSNLSSSASFGGLMQKFKLQALVQLLQQKITTEISKGETNEKLQNQVREKMEILQKARDSAEKGDWDNDMRKEAKKAKNELLEIFKSENIGVVGNKRKMAPVTPSTFTEMTSKINEVIFKEIEEVVDKASFISKLDELRSEMGKGAGKDKYKVENLLKELREEIRASLDADELEQKAISTLVLQAPQAVGAVAQQ